MVFRSVPGRIIPAALVAWACSSQPNGPARHGELGRSSQITVSTAITDSLARACLKGADHAALREYEPFASANPANPDQVVAIWMASTDSDGVVLTAASSDGGASWTTPVVLPVQACAGGPTAAPLAGDPWVAFAPDGRVYAGAIGVGLTPDRNSVAYNALLVSASIDGGKTWGPAVVAAPHQGPDVSYDNLELTVDPTRPGTVYLATTQYQTVAPPKKLLVLRARRLKDRPGRSRG